MTVRRIPRRSATAMALVTTLMATVLTQVAMAPARAVTTDPGTFNAVGPTRVLDTRAGTQGPIAGGHTRSLAMTNFGVPGTATAVVLNVTVTQPKAAGYLTAFADGANPRPTASNVNFVAGQTVPNLVVAPVNPTNGKVDLFNGSSGRIDVIVDLSGYYTAGPPTAPGAFGAVTPTRLLDTRKTAAVAAGGTVNLPVAGVAPVPNNVSAVVLNVTATEPTATGYVTVYGGATRPTVSNLNFVRGQTVPNLVVAPVGQDGKVNLFNGSIGTVQLVADVFGYFLSGTPTVPGSFVSLPPTRELDTRSGVPVAGHGTVVLQLANSGGVPASGVSGVVLNVTVTTTMAPGFITVYGGVPRPGASNLNFVAKQTVPNLVITRVNADGSVDLYNGSAGTVNLIADVFGYYRS